MLYYANISGERLQDHWSSGNWILFIYAGNERMHKSLDEFEIWPDATTGFLWQQWVYNVKNGVITFARTFLAHLSIRLIGELLGYSRSSLHPSIVICPSVIVNNVQTYSSLKQLAWWQPNFMWSLLGYGERNFVRGVWVTRPRFPPCPYMVKTLQKPYSPEPACRFPQNLICSIGDSCPS